MKHIYILVFALFACTFTYGQSTTIYIDRQNNANPTEIGVEPDNNAVAGMGFSRGGSLKRSQPVSIEYSTRGWSAVSLEDAILKKQYIQWSINIPNDYFSFTFNDIKMLVGTTDPTNLGNFQIFYSHNGFVTDQGTPVSSSVSLPDTSQYTYFQTLETEIEANQNITFRLYVWSGSGTPTSNTSSFFIQSQLGTGNIPNPGCIITGEVGNNGLTYTGSNWIPSAPSPTTGDQLVVILGGSYELPKNTSIAVKDLVVAKNAVMLIPATSNLEVTGNLHNKGTISINSTKNTTRYSSLIVQGTIENTGKAYYNRHVNTAGKNDLISAPLSGDSFVNFLESNYYIYSNSDESLYLFGPFDKATGEYKLWTANEPATLLPGVGYRAGSQDMNAFRFSGKINNSTIQVPIYNNGPSFKKWNLIGNPYPAYISLDAFLEENLAVFEDNTSAIYGYSPDNLEEGFRDLWTIWNNNNKGQGLLIAPGQGFYVSTLSSATTVKFTPEMMRTGSSDDFIAGRPANSNTASATLRLKTGAKLYTTQLYFNESATLGLDKGYDAAAFGDQSKDLGVYTHLATDNQGVSMAVQALPFSSLGEDVRIPIGINVAKGSQVTFSLEGVNLPQGQEVYLQDMETSIQTALHQGEYTFTATSKLSGVGRFNLRFVNSTLSVPGLEQDLVQLYTTKDKTLVIGGLNGTVTKVDVYDLQGRAVYQGVLPKGKSFEQISLSQFSAGVYIVKLENTSQEKIKKIILN